ncbi:unnamed protein product [Symbiodinium sp. CCMP2456]|nr:unnamed protein product [Symbiodinium sp. CCMP2456]
MPEPPPDMTPEEQKDLLKQQAWLAGERRELERQQKLEAERAAEEQRLKHEQQMLDEQQELLEIQEEAERQERARQDENKRLAEELFKVEKRAEALRQAMISRSSGSKAQGAPARSGHLYVIPPNWPKDVLIPPIPPPVPVAQRTPSQPTPSTTSPPIPMPSTPPARSRSPVGTGSLAEQVRKVASGGEATDPKAYLRARLEAAASKNEAGETDEKASEQAYNSTTHPTEWHFLNRLVKSKKGTLDDITKAWEEGGIKRARLLRDFVVKVYSPSDDHSLNKGRLEALIRLRQSTKEWKRQKVEGAKKYCTAKKLYKTCPYTGEYKYLVLVSDTVTQGQEKLRELEELMEEAGFFNDKFQLGCGDSFEISDDETVPDSKAAANGKKGGNRTAAKASGLPMVVEGDNDLSGTLAKYKKAMLNKRTVLKEVKDREINDLYKKICEMELQNTRLDNILSLLLKPCDCNTPR